MSNMMGTMALAVNDDSVITAEGFERYLSRRCGHSTDAATIRRFKREAQKLHRQIKELALARDPVRAVRAFVTQIKNA